MAVKQSKIPTVLINHYDISGYKEVPTEEGFKLICKINIVVKELLDLSMLVCLRTQLHFGKITVGSSQH